MLARNRRVLLWLKLVLLAAARLNFAHEAENNGPWLNIITIDSVGPENKTMTGHTNADNMVVYASRFNYTNELEAIKVMIRGNLGKPSPSTDNPLVASVRNWAGGHTITVPYNVYNRRGQVLSTQDHATRYLCPAEVGNLEHVVVSVGTGYLNPKNESFTFQVTFQRVGHWSLQLDAPQKLQIKTTDPAVFAFRWPAGAPDTILLNVSTVMAPEICTTVALQPHVCPLAQTPAEIAAGASFFTMTASGALVVRRAQFPDGFFLLMMPLVDDVPCDPAAPEVTTASRQKTVIVTLSAQRSPLGLLAVPAVLALLLLVVGAASSRLLRWDLNAPRLEIQQEQERHASLSTSDELLLEPEPESASALPQLPPSTGRSAVSLLVGGALLLLALCGSALLAALGAQTSAGDLDVCYRNELCSHASGGVPEVNHVLAHVPYIGAGLGVLLAVMAQRSVYRRITADDAIKVGVQHEWGLLNAVGLAMVLQGVLGGLQSVCPGPDTAPLDVAFVYFALAALACKLFQTRRGCSAAGHYTPLLLTAALVLVGLAKQRAGNTWYAWVVLALLHVLATVVIATQLYVLGEVSIGLRTVKRVWDWSYLLPDSPNFLINRSVFTAALVVNFSLAIAGAAAKMPDFNHYVMIFFVLHMALYLAYYLLLKLVRSEECVGRPSVALLAAGALLLLTAVITLAGWSTTSTETPSAASRLLSRACLAGGLFDTNDLWHMLAAPALLCLTLGVLLLDDNLLLTPRMEIRRF